MGFGIWSPRLVFLFVILGYLVTVQSQPRTAEQMRVLDAFDKCTQDWPISTGRKCDNATTKMLEDTLFKKYPGKPKGDWIFFATPKEVKEYLSTICGFGNGYVCKAEGCGCAANGTFEGDTTCDEKKPHTQNLANTCEKEIKSYRDCALQNICGSSSGTGMSPSIVIMFLAAVGAACLRSVIIRSP